MATDAKTAKKSRKKQGKMAPAPVFRVRIITSRGCLALRYATRG